MVGVGAVYAVGRQLWDRRTGLVAAAVLCFAFLPVAFSRLAVTDVGTLAPVAVVLLLSVRIARGRRVAHVPVGRASPPGLAIGFKYTAGLVLLAPGARARAAAARARATARPCAPPRPACSRSRRAPARRSSSPTRTSSSTSTPRCTSCAARPSWPGNQDKFGQEHDVGPLYYLDSLLWGLGYVAALAAAGGAVALARRDRVRLAILLIFPVALFLYLSVQSRFFGRWLLPVYPALALLAGYGFVQRSTLVRARAPRLQWPALGVGLVLLLWQPLAADARSMAVLGREDTRAIARQWLAEHNRRELRAIIEPAVPERYYWPVRDGRPQRLPRAQFVNEFIRDIREEHVEYGRTLRPRVLDRYRAEGYCTIVTFDLIRGRAEAAGDRARARLLRRARARSPT